MPRSEFKVTKGEPKHYNAKGDSGKMNDHWFCGGMFLSFSLDVGSWGGDWYEGEGLLLMSV